MNNYLDKSNWIDLNCLPKDKRGYIDWIKSQGMSVAFKYNDISGSILLQEYVPNKQIFHVYIDGYTKTQYDIISVTSIRNCKIGRLLHKKIIDTNPELVRYFVNSDDAKKYSRQSNVIAAVKCPICGFIKNQYIYNLYQDGFSCPQCSDGKSWPEKFMFNIFNQLNIDFKTEVTKHDKGFEWINGEYRYDFYFQNKNINYLIETDGAFHNDKNIQEIDRIKDNLAIMNEMKIIRIDCKYPKVSERFEYIKNNILHSDLRNIFDLSLVNWDIANDAALDSNIRIAAKLWSDGLSVTEISNNLKICFKTTREYLHIANKIGLCTYNTISSTERKNISCARIAREKTGKPIALYNNDVLINVFYSASELDRLSVDIYGIRMNRQNIVAVCKGNRKHVGGFSVRYISRETYKQLLPQFSTTQN